MLNFHFRFQNYLIIPASLIFVSLIISCGSDNNKANLVHPDVKYRSDTMYAHRRSIIIDEMDSICIVKEDELMSQMIDSLYADNKEKIDAILNRTSK